jgi:hypothetical protein
MLTSEEVREITNTFSDDAWEWPMKRRANRKVVQALLKDRAELEAEIERLRGAINEQRNVAEATLFQYDVLMKHAERLRDVVEIVQEAAESNWPTFYDIAVGRCEAIRSALAALEARDE